MVLARSVLMRFGEHQTVYRAEDEPGGIYGLASGSLGQFVTTPDTGLILAHIVHAGDWFGFGPLFNQSVRSVSFRSLEPSSALYLSLPALNEIKSREPMAAHCLGALGTVCLASCAQTVASLLIRRSDQRIAATLLRAAGDAGQGSGAPAMIRVSQAALGEMANASRHLVNRTLQSFERHGWIASGYNRIEVRDSAALASFAASGVAPGRARQPERTAC
jgi:CRP-like cAMP-binding protein